MYRIQIFENFETKTEIDYKRWKRKNVTIRGMREIGQENNSGAMLGRGLYSASLSNRALAKQYGKVYFVLNARPKNPKQFRDLNQWEIWFQQNLLKPFNFSRRKFEAATTIEAEMLKLGYDGIEIVGREMVNFNPPENIMYFSSEDELRAYYFE